MAATPKYDPAKAKALRERLKNEKEGRVNPLQARKRFQQQCDQLMRRIEQLQVDYHRFFAGDLTTPPDDDRETLVQEIRKMRASNLKGTAENFRIGSIEARLNSLSELMGRRVRAHEMGAGRRRQADAGPQHDIEKGVVFGARVQDGAVEALYKGLYMRPGQPAPSMDLDRFRSYIDRQAQALRSKANCDAISFRIAEEGGRMKLKAKPIRGE
ncbi:MAG: MXAN_5187 C-terminal domain-containing protein [Acidobacteriota bacterium]